MTDFCMPSLGATMDFGTLVEWKIKVGDEVQKGDIVAIVETEKATIEIEVFDTGTIAEIVVPVGEKVPVGAVLARIRSKGETLSKSDDVDESDEQPITEVIRVPIAEKKEMPATTMETAPPSHRLRISPAARKLARELHVEPAGIEGTGRGGAISLADVERVAARQSAKPRAAKATDDRNAQVMHAMGVAMAKSKREIPHYYLAKTINLGNALSWLSTENERRSIADRLLPAALLYKATALALHEVPQLNGIFVKEKFVPNAAVHLGIAISLRGGGTLSPVIADAETKSLTEVMQCLSGLVQRTRKGILRSTEMTTPTATVTSLGNSGVDTVFAVITPPQVAMVGFGAIVEAPWVHNAAITATQVVTASLAADHRVSEGRQGARFLEILDKKLQEPGGLV